MAVPTPPYMATPNVYSHYENIGKAWQDLAGAPGRFVELASDLELAKAKKETLAKQKIAATQKTENLKQQAKIDKITLEKALDSKEGVAELRKLARLRTEQFFPNIDPESVDKVLKTKDAEGVAHYIQNIYQGFSMQATAVAEVDGMGTPEEHYQFFASWPQGPGAFSINPEAFQKTQKGFVTNYQDSYYLKTVAPKFQKYLEKNYAGIEGKEMDTKRVALDFATQEDISMNPYIQEKLAGQAGLYAGTPKEISDKTYAEAQEGRKEKGDFRQTQSELESQKTTAFSKFSDSDILDDRLDWLYSYRQAEEALEDYDRMREFGTEVLRFHVPSTGDKRKIAAEHLNADLGHRYGNRKSMEGEFKKSANLKSIFKDVDDIWSEVPKTKVIEKKAWYEKWFGKSGQKKPESPPGRPTGGTFIQPKSKGEADTDPLPEHPQKNPLKPEPALEEEEKGTGVQLPMGRSYARRGTYGQGGRGIQGQQTPLLRTPRVV